MFEIDPRCSNIYRDTLPLTIYSYIGPDDMIWLSATERGLGYNDSEYILST